MVPEYPKLCIWGKFSEQVLQDSHEGNPLVEKSHRNGWKRCSVEIEVAALIISLALSRASSLQSQAYKMMLSRPLHGRSKIQRQGGKQKICRAFVGISWEIQKDSQFPKHLSDISKVVSKRNTLMIFLTFKQGSSKWQLPMAILSTLLTEWKTISNSLPVYW